VTKKCTGIASARLEILAEIYNKGRLFIGFFVLNLYNFLTHCFIWLDYGSNQAKR